MSCPFSDFLPNSSRTRKATANGAGLRGRRVGHGSISLLRDGFCDSKKQLNVIIGESDIQGL